MTFVSIIEKKHLPIICKHELDYHVYYAHIFIYAMVTANRDIYIYCLESGYKAIKACKSKQIMHIQFIC